jgi:hypothetical protein
VQSRGLGPPKHRTSTGGAWKSGELGGEEHRRVERCARCDEPIIRFELARVW